MVVHDPTKIVKKWNRYISHKKFAKHEDGKKIKK